MDHNIDCKEQLTTLSVYHKSDPQWVLFKSAKRRGDLCLFSTLLNHSVKMMSDSLITLLCSPTYRIVSEGHMPRVNGITLCPVPYRSESLACRGFSPQHLIAERLQERLNIDLKRAESTPLNSWRARCDFDRLQRVKETPAQTGLTRIERLSAQSGSLRLNVQDQDSWHSELVIVIDDVVTTGSTITESVRAFRESSIDLCYAVTIFAA